MGDKDIKVQTGKNDPKDWMAQYFNYDKNGREERKNAPKTTKWNAGQHSFEENLKKFKECQGKVYASYKEHLKILTNGAEDPIKYINDGINYLQECINNEVEKNADIDISEFHNVFDYLENLFNPEKIDYLNSKETTISESLFDFKINTIINPEDYENIFNSLVEKKLITRQHADDYFKVIKALSTDAPNLGIDADTLEIMSELAPYISAIEDKIQRIAFNSGDEIEVTSKDFDPDAYNAQISAKNPLNNEKDPLYPVLTGGRVISGKIRDYVAGKSEEVPTQADYAAYFDLLEQVVKTAPLYKESGIHNDVIEKCIEACEGILIFAPALKDRCTKLKSYLTQKYVDEFNRNAQIVYNEDDAKAQYANENILELSKLECCPKELFDE